MGQRRTLPAMSRLVWDSATGGTCPRCRRALAKCHCAQQIAANTVPPGDGVVRVRREVRNGKTLTVVLGLPLRADALAAFAAKLKAGCGTGGTAKDGAIELQGDHRDKVVDLLQKAGHQVKLAGG
ncbi:MAG: stress response translation initiation inhibitor YciH [Planctomycetes bacterium]|nr:stress response translation initiation inhibitor YciH [Planctomycetota bacterium]